MKIWLLALAIAPSLGGAVAGASAPAHLPGVADPARARIDYMLKCQGCHRPDGSGDARTTPSMKGFVARFLHVEGGREFIARVPGVASVDLTDERLADVVNWSLYRFDADNIPASFRPYTPTEIGKLRRQPLRIERAETRARIVAQMKN